MTTISSNGTARRHSACRSAAALALPALLALLAAVSCGKKADDETAWKSFEILMDSSFGEGGWSAASHSFDPAASVLTVTGIEADLSRRPHALPPEYEGLLTGKARIASVSVAGILEPSAMRETAAATSWRGKPERLLASSVSMRGLSAPLGSGDFTIEASADEIDLGSVKLLANGDTAPAQGESDLSLLSSLDIASLSKKGVRISLKFPGSILEAGYGNGTAGSASAGGAAPPAGNVTDSGPAGDSAGSTGALQELEADGGDGGAAGADASWAGVPAPAAPPVEIEATLGSFEGRGLGFAPQPLPYPGAPPLLGLLIGQRAQSLAWKDLKVTASGLPGNGKAALAAASSEIQGLEKFGKTASTKLQGFSAEFESPSGPVGSSPVTFKLGSIETVGMDFTPAMEAYMPAVAEALASGDLSAAKKARTLAEYVVDPYTFESVSFEGLDMKFAGVSFADARFSRTGPVRAWTLSPNRTEFSARVSFGAEGPGASPEQEETLRKLRDLFGRTEFGVNYSGSLAVSEQGGWSYTLADLGADGVASLSGNLRLTGITQDLVDNLRRIRVEEADLLSIMGVIATFGVERLSVNLDDTSLTQALVKSSAEASGSTPEEVKAELVFDLAASLAEQFEQVPPRAFAPLLGAYGDFLAAPSSFTLSVAPSAPITVTSLTPFYTSPDIPGLMQFLNITVRNGSSPPVPFLDVTALTADPPEEPSEPMEETDIE
ncbi:MAG: hypothetical protein LBQ79_08040 [Deltaproteobacteria bacterium]|jgi:hypothetical protein|nr:hypothetical protein [Deltaproteobacteria bacterium]